MMRAVAVTRLITADDAPVLAELQQANREFLAPWSPQRSAAYFTVDGQRRVVADVLALHAKGTALPHVILNGFLRFGYAPAYLKIAGEWQDHVLYQALSDGAGSVGDGAGGASGRRDEAGGASVGSAA